MIESIEIDPIEPRRTRVSVIMPVYNGERYVAQAIESILAQTHRHFEVIIVNDGSTDRTAQILDSYAAHDQRIRVIHQANIGQPAALNRALRVARCDWVAIIDHDDIALPERLERQLDFIVRHADVRALGTYAFVIDADGNYIRDSFFGVTTETQFREVRDANEFVSLIHPSVLFHRPTVLALGGYDPQFGPSADTELWSRIADEHLILVVPEPLVMYRIHSRSMSATHFFEQRFNLRWIIARQRARRRGLPAPSLMDYRRAEAGRWFASGWSVRHAETINYLRYHRQIAQREGRTLALLMLTGSMLVLRPSRSTAKAMRRARLAMRAVTARRNDLNETNALDS